MWEKNLHDGANAFSFGILAMFVEDVVQLRW